MISCLKHKAKFSLSSIYDRYPIYTSSMVISISGSTRILSAASSEFSTNSLTEVYNDLAGVSNPAIVLFSAKNSAGDFCCDFLVCFLLIFVSLVYHDGRCVTMDAYPPLLLTYTSFLMMMMMPIGSDRIGSDEKRLRFRFLWDSLK